MKERLEKMLDVDINSVEEEDDDTIMLDLEEEDIGKAIGFEGSNIRAAEKVLDKSIEVKKEEE